MASTGVSNPFAVTWCNTIGYTFLTYLQVNSSLIFTSNDTLAYVRFRSCCLSELTTKQFLSTKELHRDYYNMIYYYELDNDY